MNWFLAHLLLTFLWAALLGSYDLATVASGFVVGFLMLALTLRAATAAYRKRVLSVFRFILFYLKEILFSNLRIAGDLLRSKPALQPGIVAVRVDALSKRSAVIVANLITMTPGTLSLDLSPDGKFLYVHCLYLGDPDTTRRSMEREYVGAVAAFQQKI